MASRLRVPALALATVSIILSVAVVACAGRALNFYNGQHKDNLWLLPMWPEYFDTRGLQAEVGSAAVIIALDAGVLLAVLLSTLPSNAIIFLCSLLSTTASIVAIAFPAVLHHQSSGPAQYTLQTWACSWQNVDISRGDAPPARFGSLCNETRFSYYATIPLFLMQLGLLGLAVMALLGRGAGSNSSRAAKRGSRILVDGEMGTREKSARSNVEMGRMRQQTRASSLESSSTKSARALVVEPKSAGYAS